MNPQAGHKYTLGVSVIICCYNSARTIAKAVQGILNQQYDTLQHVELIIVDNCCTDDTENIVRNLLCKHDGIDHRYLYESKAGLAHARLRGIENARYEMLVFCDDDNVLDQHYLERVFATMGSNENVSMLGGEGTPVFESEPDPRILPFIEQYAVGPQGHGQLHNVTLDRGYLYGAGMAMRKSHFELLRNKGFKFYNLGRSGDLLTGSEDIELGNAMALVGLGQYYASDLKFDHYLTQDRLTWNYLYRMNAGSGRSAPLLIPYQLKKQGYSSWRLYILPLFFFKVYCICLLKSWFNISDELILLRAKNWAAIKSSVVNYPTVFNSWHNLNNMLRASIS